MSDNHDDIINLPHHVSKTRLHMSLIDRAAQFSPFAALTGYDAAVKETARLTDSRIELDEYEKAALNERLRLVREQIDEHPQITITYFEPDDKKAGGAYLTVTDCVKKLDDFEGMVCLTDGVMIAISEIVGIEGQLIQKYFGNEE